MNNELQSLLNERRLPNILKMNDGRDVSAENFSERRREILDILANDEYGIMPKALGKTTWTENRKDNILCGKAIEHHMTVTFPTPDGESFSFPVNLVVPKNASAENKLPAMIYIAFDNRYYYPAEEIIDNDVIVVEIQYESVSLDSYGTHDKMMDAHFFKNGERKEKDFGKIGMWAYAASRTLDCLLELDYVDKNRIGVIGHSRLGKTALWAGANDERFTHVYSNDSGCSGAALERGKIGERFTNITKVFGYWFCENMKNYTDNAETLPFDQHFLIAACAPRKVYVSSASLDEWADPTSEYLSCTAASSAWEIIGQKGFVHPNRLPIPDERFAEGDIGYHLRKGTHWLSRYDWNRFIEFLKA